MHSPSNKVLPDLINPEPHGSYVKCLESIKRMRALTEWVWLTCTVAPPCCCSLDYMAKFRSRWVHRSSFCFHTLHALSLESKIKKSFTFLSCVSSSLHSGQLILHKTRLNISIRLKRQMTTCDRETTKQYFFVSAVACSVVHFWYMCNQ